MAKKRYKPVISKAHIFDGDTGLEDLFSDMQEARCGNCGQLFGLTTGSVRDDDYFKENYNFCNKCGAPTDWSGEEKDE